MKTARKVDLSRLPVEVKQLINAGVYALYTIRGEDALYALVTDKREFYLLSAAGDVTKDARFKDLNSIPFGEVVTFPDLPSTSSIKVNYA